VTAGTDKVMTNQQTPTLGEVSEETGTSDVLMKLKGECRERPQLLQRQFNLRATTAVAKTV